MTIYVVDAHALIWFLSQDRRIGRRAARVLAEPFQRVVVPAIALAEIRYLHERRRSRISLDDVLEFMAERPQLEVRATDLVTVQHVPPGFELHDGLILATALLLARRGEAVVLVTRDERLTNAGLVRVLW